LWPGQKPPPTTEPAADQQPDPSTVERRQQILDKEQLAYSPKSSRQPDAPWAAPS